MMDEVLQNEIDSLYNQTEVQFSGLFVTNGVQHEIVKGKPAQTIRCKYDGGSFVGKLVGIANEGKCLVGKLGMDDLRTFPTAPGKRHTLVKDWDPNDTYCAVSQSSIMSFGERSIRTSLRRDNLQLCFFDGDEWKAETVAPAPVVAAPVVAPVVAPVDNQSALHDFETRHNGRYRWRKNNKQKWYRVVFWVPNNLGIDVFEQNISDGQVFVIQSGDQGPFGNYWRVTFSQLRNM